MQDPDSYFANQPGDEYLNKLVASETFIAIAAFSGDRVVGGLTGYVLPKFEQQRSDPYIYDLAVAEDWRRRGIATEMIESLRIAAADRGIYVIFVQADYGDDPARSRCTPRSERGKMSCPSISRLAAARPEQGNTSLPGGTILRNNGARRGCCSATGSDTSW